MLRVNEQPLNTSYVVKLSLGGEEQNTFVTRPWKSGERHSGYILNTSLLKTLERDVFILDVFLHLSRRSLVRGPYLEAFEIHLFPVFFLSKQLLQDGVLLELLGEKLN